MKIKKDYSYGVVPVHKKKNGDYEILIIHQYSSVEGSTYWVFPKGHSEGNETRQQTALRELKEETGLTACLLEKEFVLSYNFTHQGILIEKEVVFFVGLVEETQCTIQTEEVKEAVWLPPQQVLDRLTHQNVKSLFTEVDQYIKQQN